MNPDAAVLAFAESDVKARFGANQREHYQFAVREILLQAGEKREEALSNVLWYYLGCDSQINSAGYTKELQRILPFIQGIAEDMHTTFQGTLTFDPANYQLEDALTYLQDNGYLGTITPTAPPFVEEWDYNSELVHATQFPADLTATAANTNIGGTPYLTYRMIFSINAPQAGAIYDPLGPASVPNLADAQRTRWNIVLVAQAFDAGTPDQQVIVFAHVTKSQIGTPHTAYHTGGLLDDTVDGTISALSGTSFSTLYNYQSIVEQMAASLTAVVIPRAYDPIASQQVSANSGLQNRAFGYGVLPWQSDALDRIVRSQYGISGLEILTQTQYKRIGPDEPMENLRIAGSQVILHNTHPVYAYKLRVLEARAVTTINTII